MASTLFLSLPFDILLSISVLLPYSGIIALSQTCSSLREFTETRPVHRLTAKLILDGCVGIGVKGFGGGGLNSLPDKELKQAVYIARKRLEWAARAPVPAKNSDTSHFLSPTLGKWYNYIDVDEDLVDWISPISSDYLLCALKEGRVLVLGVHKQKMPLAEWRPPPSINGGSDKWELWKCRVEFIHQRVWFVMARVLDDPDAEPGGEEADTLKLTEFTLLSLDFKGSTNGDEEEPTFTRHTTFALPGIVMNIFLLRVSGLEPNIYPPDSPASDPASYIPDTVSDTIRRRNKIISSLTWIPQTASIGLFVFFGWREPSSIPTHDEDEHDQEDERWVWVDTGIGCNPSTNFSCVLHSNCVVIHRDETTRSIQYIYPLNTLREFAISIWETDEDTPSPSSSTDTLPMTGSSPTRATNGTYSAPCTNGSTNGSAIPKLRKLMLPMCRLVPPQTLEVGLKFPKPLPPPPEEASWQTIAMKAIFDLCFGEEPAAAESPSLVPSTPPVPAEATEKPFNPYRSPFRYPTWLTESSHFVRQWWPGFPDQNSRISSSSRGLIETLTNDDNAEDGDSIHSLVHDGWEASEQEPAKLNNSVILLSTSNIHDPPNTPKSFVLMQHYFWCPVKPEVSLIQSQPPVTGSDDEEPEDEPLNPAEPAEEDLSDAPTMPVFYTKPFRIVCIPSDKLTCEIAVVNTSDEEGAGGGGGGSDQVDIGEDDDSISGEDFDDSDSDDYGHKADDEAEGPLDPPPPTEEELMRAKLQLTNSWPLLAVDFGHAVWVEYDDDATLAGAIPGSYDPEDLRPKMSLKFITFPPPPVPDGPMDRHAPRFKNYDESDESKPTPYIGEGTTIEIPEDLDLSKVESLNLDQTQGAVIIGVKGGRVYFLCYE